MPKKFKTGRFFAKKFNENKKFSTLKHREINCRDNSPLPARYQSMHATASYARVYQASKGWQTSPLGRVQYIVEADKRSRKAERSTAFAADKRRRSRSIEHDVRAKQAKACDAEQAVFQSVDKRYFYVLKSRVV